MKKYFEILSHCSIFKGVDSCELEEVICCLNGRITQYDKGSSIFSEGDPVRYVGIVLEGNVQVVRENYYGIRSVLAGLGPGELFAEVFSCAALDYIPVGVVAQTDCKIMFLDCRRVFDSDNDFYRLHSIIIRNLLKELATKNLALTQKIRYMSQKTTREKLLAFLSDQAKLHSSSSFIIPFDRQSLADYLGVERSAMSAEIGKLKHSGIIDTKGSWFRLI